MNTTARIIMAIFTSAILCATTPSHAGKFQSCAAVGLANKAVDSGMNHLVRNYPGTLMYYGVTATMIEHSNPKAIEEVAAGITAALIGCAILIDTESCDFVAGRLITVMTARAAVCTADKKMGCGVCN